MDGAHFTSEELQQALADVARLMSIPTRSPRWVKQPWWAWPLNVTRTRPIPAGSGWIDYIRIQLGQTDLAPTGYSLRLAAFTGTGENDPLVTGMTYRFIRNGQRLPAQEFDITNTIEKHLERYSGVTFPFPTWARKMFLIVPNDGLLQLQVNNPSGAEELAFASLYGYYYPNLGDQGKGSLEATAVGHIDSDRIGT